MGQETLLVSRKQKWYRRINCSHWKGVKAIETPDLPFFFFVNDGVKECNPS